MGIIIIYAVNDDIANKQIILVVLDNIVPTMVRDIYIYIYSNNSKSITPMVYLALYRCLYVFYI
jgi:hypothetical protein